MPNSVVTFSTQEYTTDAISKVLCEKLLLDSKVFIWRIGITKCEFKQYKTWETLTLTTGYAGFTYPRPGAKISTLCQPAEPFIKNTLEKFVALIIWAGSARGKIAHSTLHALARIFTCLHFYPN